MPRNERVHHYERPHLHDLSAHDRQAEPVALCESVSALVCAWDALWVCVQSLPPSDPEREALADLWLDAQDLLHRLTGIVGPLQSEDREAWITEAELTAGFIMATVDRQP